MSLLKKLGKGIAIASVSMLPYLSNSEEWLARLDVTANTTNGVPSPDYIRFGVKGNGERMNEAPAPPNSFNLYNTLTNSTTKFIKNYVATNEIPIFRGGIENTGATPTSVVARASGLPNDSYMMIGFSNVGRTTTNGVYELKNDTDFNIKTNTLGFILTRKPVFTDVYFPQSGKVGLDASFFCDGTISNLDIYGAVGLDKAFTNYLGKVKNISGDKYKGTNNVGSAKFWKAILK